MIMIDGMLTIIDICPARPLFSNENRNYWQYLKAIPTHLRVCYGFIMHFIIV